MQLVGNSWDQILEDEYHKDYFKKIVLYINKAYKEREIYPPKNYILRALYLTDYKDVKVVILGQDPYHGIGEANGLAFAVNNGIKLPPSLKNIYKELNDDLNIKISNNGDLTCWAKEGDTPVVFILWGNFAKSKKNLITNPKHLVIESSHPSPFSCNYGFFGSRPFSKANNFLKEHNIKEIDFTVK